jgi:hemerythrin-like domain-containing protein
MKTTRRELFVFAPGALLAAHALGAEPAAPADVNATEDLMREHGVLRRTLLVYEEAARQLEKGGEPVSAIATAARLVQRFIEGYHEKLEERFVFPKFDKHPTLGPLVATLRMQHEVGRKLTTEILAQASQPLKDRSNQAPLVRALRDFCHMYAAHAAREDTDLFPAFHALYTEKEFDALGDQFEDEEHKLLGNGGFEGAVKEIAQVEAQLGIADLAGYTPKV